MKQRGLYKLLSLYYDRRIQTALMIYRTTPVSSTGFSPSQLLMGRQISTTLPTLDRKLQPNWPTPSVVQANDDKAKDSQKYYFDKRNGVRPLPELSPGEQVLIKTDKEKTWSNPSTVTTEVVPRSLTVQGNHTPNRTTRRNRRHLQLLSPPTVPDFPMMPSQNDSDVPTATTPSPARNTVHQGRPPDNVPGVVMTSPARDVPSHGRPPDNMSGVITTKSGRVSKPVNRLDL